MALEKVAELSINKLDDRKIVTAILHENGYTVGPGKRKATPTGKQIDYYLKIYRDTELGNGKQEAASGKRGKVYCSWRTAGKSKTTICKNGQLYKNGTIRYENLVKLFYQQETKGIKLDGEIAAKITGVFSVPKSVSKKNRRLMLQGKILHTKKIDCDNLAKIVLDAT